MTYLHQDWITEGLLDPEYKKYVLLAYMQNVKANFDEKRLYPFLSDLVLHYNNLLAIKDNKKLLYENFPKRISKADFEKLKIKYRTIVEDDRLMEGISEVINFAIEEFKDTLEMGRGIFDHIAKSVAIEPIGIMPLYTYEGYLFIKEYNSNETQVYQYQITVFEKANEKYKAIKTEFLENKKIGIGYSFEKLKADLISQNKSFPNPATYLARAEVKCPVKETLLPITKRLLMRQIGKAA